MRNYSIELQNEVAGKFGHVISDEAKGVTDRCKTDSILIELLESVRANLYETENALIYINCIIKENVVNKIERES